MTKPLVSIIILGWNNYDDIEKCLDSLKKCSYKNFNIFLVDNGSKKESLDTFEHYLSNLDEDFLKRVNFSKSKVNLGFTGGCNLGFKLAKKTNPRYVLLLNGDTVVDPHFIDPVVKVFEGDAQIGSVQSVLIRFDRKRIDSLGLEMSGARFFDSKQLEKRVIIKGLEPVTEIFGACGAGAFYRVKLIDKIGLLDEKLFATFEDLDLAWRIRLNGLKSVLVKDSIIYHRGGVSRFKAKDHVMFDLRSYYPAKNMVMIFYRYYPVRFKVIAKLGIQMVVAAISAIKNHKFKDLISSLGDLPRERKLNSKNSMIAKVRRDWIK